ncbi:hypothetical protein [Aequorivita capsosiphonis]|uniref:hypothetical protein n=1 Tax=Aequorivita capsosiphonis TaxID=487317 RepID=UPI0003FD2F09|nr:hypothetical protein [Aequorivita capsosiphonis]
MKNKIKIIHIHKDPKFVHWVNMYSQDFFENQLVFLGESNSISNEYDNLLVSMPKDEEDRFLKIIELCENSDLVTINNLNSYALKITLALSLEVKIVWRFFGWELYSKDPKLIYSEKTRQLRPSYPKPSFTIQLKQYIWNLLYETPFEKAIKRMDYFIGLMDDEYLYFKKLGYKLPPFIQAPYLQSQPVKIDLVKSKLIVFGNSKNISNNHLDILETLKNVSLDNELKIKMFFSYGKETEYEKATKIEAKKNEQIEIEEDFLSKEEFKKVYIHAAAFIFNGYRQMAMGNIFTAIKYGVKIYLSDKNNSSNWFLKNGFIIFSIERHLEEDLRNNNYYLTQEDITNNIAMYVELTKKYNVSKFNQKILKIATDNL